MIRFLFALLLVFLAVPAIAADRLCPDVETLKAQPPETMTGVQAEIDRIKLCVERAKLLKQLDELAEARRDILKKVTAPDASLSMSNVPIPALPVGSLPALPETTVATQQPVKAIESKEWRVRKIWGQMTETGTVMRAQLSNGGSALLNVAKGDILPDGTMVQSLSVRGVTLSQNGKTSDLEWDQQPLSP